MWAWYGDVGFRYLKHIDLLSSSHFQRARASEKRFLKNTTQRITFDLNSLSLISPTFRMLSWKHYLCNHGLIPPLISSQFFPSLQLKIISGLATQRPVNGKWHRTGPGVWALGPLDGGERCIMNCTRKGTLKPFTGGSENTIPFLVLQIIYDPWI